MKTSEMIEWFSGPKYSRVYYVSPYGDVRCCRPDMTTRTLVPKKGSRTELTVVHGVYGQPLKEPVELTSGELFYNRLEATCSLHNSGREKGK